MVCAKVDDYIDKIIKELNLPTLAVIDKLLSHDRLKEKLKDDHLKRMVVLSRIEEFDDGTLEKFVATRATTRRQESMMFIQFRLNVSFKPD